MKNLKVLLCLLFLSAALSSCVYRGYNRRYDDNRYGYNNRYRRPVIRIVPPPIFINPPRISARRYDDRGHRRGRRR